MPNKGGRYEIRGGKRVLVERTKPAPNPKPEAAPTKAPKAAAKQAGADVKQEKDDG